MPSRMRSSSAYQQVTQHSRALAAPSSRQHQQQLRNGSSTTAQPPQLAPAPYIPRRSLLYVPGDDTRKLRKASQLHCDFIALDCEDGVAVSRKQQARDTIRAFYDSNLNELPSKFDQYRQSEWSVRVNGVASGLCEEDLRVVVAGKRVPETLLLPKCESGAELKEVSVVGRWFGVFNGCFCV